MGHLDSYDAISEMQCDEGHTRQQLAYFSRKRELASAVVVKIRG